MKHVFKAEKPGALLDFLSSQLSGVTMTALKEQMKRREIKVNKIRVSANIGLSAGDIVEIFLPEKFSSPAQINILFSDENIIVADKPAMTETESCLKNLTEKGYDQAYPVHRLDRNTKGIVLFARNERAKDALILAFKNHSFAKSYSAIVKGRPKISEATLTAYLKKDAENSFCTVSEKMLPGSKEIITSYRIVKTLGDLSLLKIGLITGRTHQIRAHMAFIGHPVLGDGKYGDPEINKKYGCRWQQLIASDLTLDGLTAEFAYLNGKKLVSDMSFDILPDYID